MFLAVLALLLSIISLCVGSTYAKMLFAQLGPEGATVMRVGFAALMLLAVWRPWRLSLSRRQAGLIVLYGLILGAMNLLFYKGIETIPIGVAIAIEFIGPLALAVCTSRRALDFVWIAFAAVGMFLLSPFATGGVSSLDPVGVTYILVAAVLWALYIVIGKEVGRGHSGQVTSLGMTAAGLVVLPFGITHLSRAIAEPSLLLAGVVVAVMSSAIPFTLELYALKRMPKQTFGILLSMEPVAGALTGLFMLNEVLTPLQWLAITAIITASVGCTVGLRKQEDVPLSDADGIALTQLDPAD